MRDDYKWVAEGDHLVCFPSPFAYQTLGHLVVPEKLTAIHDSTLSRATSEINEILDRVSRENSNEKVEPSFIIIPGGKLMLVWAQVKHPVSPDSGREAIAEVLGLRIEDVGGD
ncbi:hypothetical protein SUDANB120_06183 (plasmid) [Streptomyces sp. enrichment culture]|uniref:hypothetical protein n=1 Tax=Streptomyces sp. enrichment culture TaxID=1795815 RepID=UPI003F55A14D